MFALPTAVNIFDSAGSTVLDMEELAGYCRDLLPGVFVVSRGDFVSYCAESLDEGARAVVKDEIARGIAHARVSDPGAEAGQAEPLPGLVAYERRMLDRESPRPVGVFYDGFALCRACADLLSLSGRREDGWSIVITNQLFGTFEESDSRYHARVSIYGDPCLISTTGMVEAPARPRAYYIEKQMGRDASILDREFAGAFLEREDPRTTEVLKCYLAQAAFYYMIGEPFCEDRTCRLYNAHWQADLLKARSSEGAGLCPEHERLLARILEESENG